MISTVYFRPGETPMLVLPVNIIDDGSIEGDEYFTLQLQSFDLSIVLVNSIVKILVEDNERERENGSCLSGRDHLHISLVLVVC